MHRKRSDNKRYQLENLEPRILLSADPLVGAVASLALGEQDSEESPLTTLEEVLASEESKAYDSPSPDSESYDPAESLDDIFSGLTGEDLSSDEVDEPSEVDENYDINLPIGDSEETQILLGLTELVRLGETVELSEVMASPLPGLGDASLGELIGLGEILDSRLAKSVFDYFGDAVDPPTGEGVVQALNESFNTLGDLEIKVSSLEGGFVSTAGEFRFDIAFTATREGQLLLGDEETGSDQSQSADYVVTLELDFSFGVDPDQTDGFFLVVRSFTVHLTVSAGDSQAGQLLEARLDVVFDEAAGPDGRLTLGELQAINSGDVDLELRMAGSLFDATNASFAPMAVVSAIESSAGGTGGQELVLDDAPSSTSAVITNVAELDLGPEDTTVIQLGDQIAVAGNANLGGTLEIVAPGPAPAVGDVFEVITYGSATGSFASFTGLDIGGGLTLVPVQRDGNFLLITVSELAGALALIATIQNELQKYIDDPALGDGTLDVESLDLGGFLQLLDIHLAFTGITVDGGGISAGSVTIEARSALLFPGSASFAVLTDGSDADALAIDGAFDPVAGTFSLVVDQLDLAVEGIFRASATDATLGYAVSGAASQTLISIANSSVVFEVLDDTRASVTGLVIRTDGFAVANASATIASVNWAGVFALTDLSLTVTGLDYSTDTGTLVGTMTIGAASVTLFESVGATNSSVTDFEGTYNFGTGALSLSAASFDLILGGAINVHAETISFELDPVANRFQVSTGPSSLDVAGFVTVSGSFGFLGDDGEVYAVGSGVTVRLEADPTVYMELANADFGLIAADGQSAFELKNGELDIQLGDVFSVSDGTVFVQYTDADTTVLAGTEIIIGTSSYTFDTEIVPSTVAFAIEGLVADVAGVFSLSGDVGFQRSGLDPEILAAGNDVTVRLEVDPTVYVELTDADFGLISGPGTFAFELKNGGLDIQLSPDFTVTGGAAFVQYTNLITEIDAETEITAGTISYTFETGIALNTVAFAIEGLEADVAGVFSLSGSLGFERAGQVPEILAVGNDVTVRLEVDPTVFVELSHADFGLISGLGKFAFELKDGGLDVQLSSALTVTGGAAFVQYTNLITEIDAETEITVGTVSYTFETAIALNTVAFAIEGLEADVAGVFSLSGALGFQRAGLGVPEILAVGEDVTVRLEVDPTVYVELSHADFGLISGLGKFAFELKDGGLDIQLSSALTVTGGAAFAQFTSLITEVDAGTKITVGTVEYIFETDIAFDTRAIAIEGLEADVAGVFSLSGSLGFSKSVLGVLAVGNDVTVRLEVDPTVYVELAHASFGLIADPGTFAFELKSGELSVALGPLAEVEADSVFVQFTNPTTSVSAGTVITVGTVSYEFVNAIGVDTLAFEAIGFSATVLGSTLTADKLSFTKDAVSLTLGGENVSVLLQAGQTRIVAVNGADFSFVIDESGFYGALRNAAVEGPDFGDDFTLTGGAGFRINTTGEVQTVTLGEDLIELPGGDIYLRVEIVEVPGVNPGDAPTPAALNVFGNSLTAKSLFFEKAGDSVSVGGEDVSLLLKAGDTRIVGVSGADFAFVFDASGFYGALRNAAIEGPDIAGLTLIGAAGLAINTTGQDRSVNLGGQPVSLLAPAGGGIFIRVDVTEAPAVGGGDPTPATLAIANVFSITATTLVFEYNGGDVHLVADNLALAIGDPASPVFELIGSLDMTFTSTHIEIAEASLTFPGEFGIGGFVSIEDPGFSLTDFRYNYSGTDPPGLVSGTVTFTASSAALFPGQAFSAAATGILGSFNLVTPAFTISLDTFKLTVGDAFVADAVGVLIQYDPDGPASQTLVLIEEGDITFTPLSIEARFEDLTIRANGFGFATFEVEFTGTIGIAGVLSFGQIGIRVEDFDVTYGEDLVFTGSITVFAGSADFFPGSSLFSATVTGVSATFNFDDSGQFESFIFHIDGLVLTLSTYLRFEAADFTLDTGAGENDFLVEFGLIGAKLTLPFATIGGEARNFAITGGGSFVTLANFGVAFEVGASNAQALGLPEWLPSGEIAVDITWPDFAGAPGIFLIDLSVSLAGTIPGTELSLEGFVEHLIIDIDLLVNGQFPIVGLGAVGVQAGGEIFGSNFQGGFFLAILKLDANGDEIDGGDLVTPVDQYVLYGGVTGTLIVAGYGGFAFRLGLSQFGPIQGYVQAVVPIPVDLGTVGFALTGFRAGVTFGSSLPSIEDARDLADDPGFKTTDELTLDEWRGRVRQGVEAQLRIIDQLLENPFAALNEVVRFEGGGSVINLYASPLAFKLDGDIIFSTDGKIFVRGDLTLGAVITIRASLYIDGSDLLNPGGPQATVLFLVEVPAQAKIVTVFGGIRFEYGEGEDPAGTDISLLGQIFNYASYDGGDITDPATGEVIDPLNPLQSELQDFRILFTGGVEISALGLITLSVEGSAELSFSPVDQTIDLEIEGKVRLEPLNADLIGLAGRLHMEVGGNNPDGVDMWGVFALKPADLALLDTVGIDVDAIAVLRINNTLDTHIETLTIPGTGEVTFTIAPLSFSLLMEGFFTFNSGGAELFRLDGTMIYTWSASDDPDVGVAAHTRRLCRCQLVDRAACGPVSDGGCHRVSTAFDRWHCGPDRDGTDHGAAV